MIEKRELLILILFSLILLLGVYLLFYYTDNLLKHELNRGIALTSFMHEGEEDDLRYRPISPEEEGIYRFNTTFSKDDFQEILTGDSRLIIYRFAGQWYRVFLNNILIGTMGNLEDDRANIWNAFASFDMDKNLIEEHNNITLEVYATYELGLLAFPPLLTDTKGATTLASWFYFILNRLHHVALGVMISAFLLLLFIQALSRRLKGEYFCYSLAALFMSIASFDFLVFHQLPMDLFTFKRLILLCLYSSIFSVSVGIGIQYKRKKNIILGSIALIGIIFLILFSPNLHFFRQGFSLLNALILLNILGWIYTSYTFFLQDSKARIFFFSSLILFILSSYDVYYIFSLEDCPFSLTVIGSLIFSIIIILLVVFYYLELQRKIAYETQRAALMYQKSVLDAMTGIYNHQYLVNTLKELRGLYSLLIIDIDDFKPINDTYGHQAGDEVIKGVAKRGLEAIRKTDIMGRYGGDEFLIILLDCDGENALKIAHTIKKIMEKPISINQGTSIGISLSIGIHTREDEDGEEVLKLADEALYFSKRGGKGGVIPYTSLKKKGEK